jgi:hypothetical protein
MPAWMGILLVLLAIGGGAWFVRWYLKDRPSAPVVIGEAPAWRHGARGNRPARENRRIRRPAPSRHPTTRAATTHRATTVPTTMQSTTRPATTRAER